MNLRWNNILRAPENDGTGGSGGAGGAPGSFITPPGGGGPPASGGQPPAGTPPSGGNPPAGNGGTGTPPSGGAPTDWRSSLPKELQDNATLKKYSDVSALAGAYINAQKLIGADKIPVPTNTTTEDEWKGIYKKLGLPEDVSKYEVKFDETVSLDKGFAEDFKKTAHAAGVLPQQAQKLADWFAEINKGSEAAVKAEQEKRFNDSVAVLKKDWGDAYTQKLAFANKLLSEVAGKEVAEHFSKMGYGADEKFIRFVAAMGEKAYKEGEIIAGGEGDGTKVLTPAEAKAEYAKIMGDPKHPYRVKDHPGHKSAVDEVQNLFKLMNPGT